MIRDKFQSSLPRLVSPTLELICALVWGMVCGAQEPYLERGDRVNGWKTRQGFEALYQDHRASVVEILDGGHQVALGTVVSDSGHIITKASELVAISKSAITRASATSLFLFRWIPK